MEHGSAFCSLAREQRKSRRAAARSRTTRWAWYVRQCMGDPNSRDSSSALDPTQSGSSLFETGTLAESVSAVSERVQRSFAQQQRTLTFDQYLGVLEEHPGRHVRDAASYVLDMVLSYGSEKVTSRGIDRVRYKLFDQSFLKPEDALAHSLVGQERAVEELVRCLANFKREGRANRVLLLHGPNGSAKSTICACLMAGLEDYSSRPEGALYRFHWVFPKKAKGRGAIGFSGSQQSPGEGTESFALLGDDELETRLFVEVRDHPLFLIPREARLQLLRKILGSEATIPRWLSEGELCHKNQQIFSALLSSYEGALREVLRHVQVERYFVSRRYRVGAVTLGPELSVDAKERQVTADRNLGALPTSLQSLSLYDVSGELVDASGGILELSDLLKRPIDAFKYLQITAETGAVSLGSQNLDLNCLLLASGNELHLSAFREHPEFESFRGRFTLIPVPYLCNFKDELAIYERQVIARLSRKVAPHAAELAARFAVLTRLLKPVEERYEEGLRPVVSEMTAWTKLLSYAGELTELEVDGRPQALRRVVAEMTREWQGAPVYEGISGVSARVMRRVLLDAALNPNYSYLSPFAVLDELDRLCEQEQDYAFLKHEPREGGFHDHKAFRRQLREWYLDTFEDELRRASGLVDETSYEELFSRYVGHVSAAVKGEKLNNPVTGKFEPPDEKLMTDVEELLQVHENRAEARTTLMGRIAAWAIEHPGEPVAGSPIYKEKVDVIRTAVFAERRLALGRLCRDLVESGFETTTSEPSARVEQTLEVLVSRFSYPVQAARAAAAQLLTERYADVVH